MRQFSVMAVLREVASNINNVLIFSGRKSDRFNFFFNHAFSVCFNADVKFDISFKKRKPYNVRVKPKLKSQDVASRVFAKHFWKTPVENIFRSLSADSRYLLNFFIDPGLWYHLILGRNSPMRNAALHTEHGKLRTAKQLILCAQRLQHTLYCSGCVCGLLQYLVCFCCLISCILY